MEIIVAVLYLLPFCKLLEPSWCLGKPFHFGIRVCPYGKLVQKNCSDLFLQVFNLWDCD